jgi:hypothetical protein
MLKRQWMPNAFVFEVILIKRTLKLDRQKYTGGGVGQKAGEKLPFFILFGEFGSWAYL